MSADHDPRWAVSASTYSCHACRCDGCTAAATAKQRKLRAARDRALVKVERHTRDAAAAWLRKNMPDLWGSLRQQAYDDLGIERRRPGRPGGVA